MTSLNFYFRIIKNIVPQNAATEKLEASSRCYDEFKLCYSGKYDEKRGKWR